MRSRKKVSIFSLALFVLCLSWGSISNAKYEELSMIDGSYLTENENSTGKSVSDTGRGKYLMVGECSITKTGRGKIYVYSQTTANNTVDFLSTILYVDQYDEDDGKWHQVGFWRQDANDTYYVNTSKTLTVERGYYYRVHAEHFAGMDGDLLYDEATSYTDGIYIN